MLPIVHTTGLNEELDTDGHSPMYFQSDMTLKNGTIQKRGIF